jgi:alanine-glyoxylate transaminase / serine-glyoxylate transaminase / serine-pyruvate transaminase
MTYRSGRHFLQIPVPAFDTGHFAALWARLASRFGLDVDLVPGDWRRGVQADQVGEKLAADPGHRIKAVTVVQNETSTGCASQIPLIRAAMDRARHPALLIVDTISSLGSVEYRHDEWGVDVTIWCSQKGMMLPPGLGVNAISEKALAGALCGVEMGLAGAGVPITRGGVSAALGYLESAA